jgi:hypothetical protein
MEYVDSDIKLYLLEGVDKLVPTPYCKIGISKDPDKRFLQIQRGIPFALDLRKVWTQDDLRLHPETIEMTVKREYRNRGRTMYCKREWFNVTAQLVEHSIKWFDKNYMK